MAKKFEKKAVGKPEVDDFADMAEPAAVAVEAEEVPAEVEPVAVTEKNYVVAAGQLAQIAVRANNNPPHGCGGWRCLGLTPCPDGEQFFAGFGSRPLLIPTAIDTYGCLDTDL
jgi:hypothetical protein